MAEGGTYTARRRQAVGYQIQRRRPSPGGAAVGPDRKPSPRAVRATLIPHGKNAALSDRAPCLLLIPARQPSQGGGNLSWLAGGLGVAAPGGLLKPCQSPVDHPLTFKIHGDYLGHFVVLKSCPAPEASQ